MSNEMIIKCTPNQVQHNQVDEEIVKNNLIAAKNNVI